jgi:glycosyltransferase involved in cell wall biosynthesis
MTLESTSTLAYTVALLIPNFEAGGAERVMIRLAQGLVERGHRVDLLVFSDHGPFRAEVDSRVNVISLGVPRAWRAIVPLARYLRRSRPNVLCSAMFHANFATILAGKLAGSPTRIVITEHNTQELVKSSVGPWRWLVFQLAQRVTYPTADAVVCVSAGIAGGLAAVMPRLRPKLTVIGNPVVTDELLRQSSEPLVHPWLAPGQPPLVLAAGRLIAAKGFDVLIEAFVQVLSDRPAKLMILGKGPERASLQSLIDQHGVAVHVCLFGFTANPYAWMRKADLFVLSSRHEGLPGVLIEAMACGCRVVATNCPHGPDEILEQGKWGRLVPTGDAQALGEAIVEELDSDRLQSTAERAQAFHLFSAVVQYERVFLFRGSAER